MSAKPETYLRFVVLASHPDTGEQAGLFTAAYDVHYNGNLPKYQVEQLDELLTWFRNNLKIPEKFNRSTSKGAWRRGGPGISWFKSNAHQHIERMRELALILNDAGYLTEEIKTQRPDYLIYEDDFQIVAQAFADTHGV